MLCPGCGHENSDSAKFCNECGVSFDAPLPQDIETSTVSSRVSADFVGRQREMAELMAALEDALAGNRPVLE